MVCRKAKSYLPLAQRAGFRERSFGWAVAEFRFKPRGWKQEHRFIMVRRPLPEDPEEAQQLTLFKAGRYAYSAFVTNLDLQPWMIWKTYQARANVEKSIRELLDYFSLNKIPTHEWVANVAFLQLLLLAYNLVHWFKRLGLPEDYASATVETIRNEFLVLPGKLTKHGSRNVLQLPKDYHHRKIFLEAARQIETLRFPEPEQGEKFGFVSSRK
jgi:Transposase DDE domain group 1